MRIQTLLAAKENTPGFLISRGWNKQMPLYKGEFKMNQILELKKSNYSRYLFTIFPQIVWLHNIRIYKHTTYNSSNQSEEGLMIEMSAFILFMVANLHL